MDETGKRRQSVLSSDDLTAFATLPESNMKSSRQIFDHSFVVTARLALRALPQAVELALTGLHFELRALSLTASAHSARVKLFYTSRAVIV